MGDGLAVHGVMDSVGGRWMSGGVWFAPAAWALLLAVGVRIGRLPDVESLAAAGIVLLALGVCRTVAGTRGGLLGRAAELVLVPGSVAVLLAEPVSARRVVVLAVAWLAGSLAVWAAVRGGGEKRRWMPAVVGTAVGVAVVPGYAGTSWWWLWAVVAVVSLAATAGLLERLAGPAPALVSVVAVAASLGASDPASWVLPPMAAAGLLALDRGRTWVGAVVGVACGVAPPAGVAVGLALIVGAAVAARRPHHLVSVAPLGGLAWLLVQGPWAAPGLDGALALLPVSPGAVSFLAPVLVLGLLEPVRSRRDGRLVLGLGALLLLVFGVGAALPSAAAALWLGAVPAAGRALARGRGAVTVPWTVGAAAAMLVAVTWGGATAWLVTSPAALALGWAIALLGALSHARAAALLWLLPAAGLVWTTPVEGGDRHLAAGERVEVRGEVVVLAGFEGQAPDVGTVAVGVDGSGPLLAGRDVPVGGTPPRHPLAVVGGAGANASSSLRGVTTRHGEVTRLTALTDVVVRSEPLGEWRARRRRVATLFGGALLLLLVAAVFGRRWENGGEPATAVLLFAVLAAGSGVAPLARLAFRGAPDLAALVLLGGWWAFRPRVRSRLLAGLLLLVPLALAQPVLRHPAGDELYHLGLMRSMAEDRDLAPADDFDADDPAQAIYLPHGNELIHSPAPAALLLPGYVAAGHTGALLLMALITALALSVGARCAEGLGLSRRGVECAWFLGLATYPALTFATQIWPAAFGMLAISLALAAAQRPSVLGTAAVTAAALLVKVRLALVTGPVVAAAWLRRRRSVLPLVLVGLAAVVVAVFLGGPLGRHRLAELVPPDLWHPVRGVWGLMWDAAGGLAFTAPLWLVAAVFLPRLWRRGGGGERALVIGAALTVTAVCVRGEWYGGGAPPARYLAPLLPLGLLALAAGMESARGRALVRLALPWTVVGAWIAATRPLWLFNPVDGGWWLTDRLARALDVTARRVVPSLLRPSPSAWIVPLLLIVLGAWWWRRGPRAGSVAATLLLLVLALAVAVGVPEPMVHAEDPQVRHVGGVAEPPPGAFARWSGGISWRLEDGDALTVPWNPPQGKTLVARVDAENGQGRLVCRWDAGLERAIPLPKPWRWQRARLPRPPGLGRHELTIRFDGSGFVLVDRLEAIRR